MTELALIGLVILAFVAGGYILEETQRGRRVANALLRWIAR
jgi:hypothetical protein